MYAATSYLVADVSAVLSAAQAFMHKVLLAKFRAHSFLLDVIADMPETGRASYDATGNHSEACDSVCCCMCG
jgi:hypothetical protein